MTLLITSLFMGLSLSGAPPANTVPFETRDHMVRVEVDGTLYQVPGSSDVWVRFRLINKTEHEVGVQIDPGLSPELWTMPSPDDQPPRWHHPQQTLPIYPAECDPLLAALREKKLLMLAAHGQTDYYWPFRDPETLRSLIETNSKKPNFVYVVRGTLRVTDGTRCDWFKSNIVSDSPGAWIWIPTPVQWANLPEGATKIPKK
jgi:hypothetical protein